ncbi:MAG: sigma-70 family RNA polymerase sigma factor [Planctomycetes bacterium]|nr:sigma-70 family RNA polymerase sigma factor [Planctomycetota bacterium]
MNYNTRDNNNFPVLWVQCQAAVQSFVFAAVRRVADAEDVMQDIAHSAFKDFDKYDPARPFAPWVMTIAHRRVADYFRQKPRAEMCFDPAALESLSIAYAELATETGQRRRALEHCLAAVEDRARQALTLRYEQQLSVQQIADKLSTSANAVSVLLYRVRAALAQCIERRLQRQEAE